MSVDTVATWLNQYQVLVISFIMPIGSAIIAWLVSIYSIKKTLQSEKERRIHESVIAISGFRQRWINDLRDALAEFQSFGVHPLTDAALERDFYRLGTKIELLMNPMDEDYEELQGIMYGLLSASSGDTIAKYKLNPDFVEVSQRILKREWERLKNELRDPASFAGSTK